MVEGWEGGEQTVIGQCRWERGGIVGRFSKMLIQVLESKQKITITTEQPTLRALLSITACEALCID